MKTDRLYALTLYLLNHGKSSASELAKHFEVSVRTIQRDIDALCQAGIPICASCDATHPGYFLASGPDELAGYLASLDRRLREVRKTRSALQSTLDDMVGQVELDGWDENSLGGG